MFIFRKEMNNSMCTARKMFVSMEKDIPPREVVCVDDRSKATHAHHFCGSFEWYDESED
jgi:hypothetical protein